MSLIKPWFLTISSSFCALVKSTVLLNLAMHGEADATHKRFQRTPSCIKHKKSWLLQVTAFDTLLILPAATNELLSLLQMFARDKPCSNVNAIKMIHLHKYLDKKDAITFGLCGNCFLLFSWYIFTRPLFFLEIQEPCVTPLLEIRKRTTSMLAPLRNFELTHRQGVERIFCRVGTNNGFFQGWPKGFFPGVGSSGALSFDQS